MKFRGKRVLVVGFGASGRAAVRFLIERGAQVTVTDSAVPSEESLLGFPLKEIECSWGGHPEEIFRKKDLIVVSPGVPLDLPPLVRARRRVPVIGEFGLAVPEIKAPVIAVTGTNGKSTTVTLIAKILEEAGMRVALAGNIGKPLLEVVMENNRPDWVVAEVSSYQLETAPRFHPKIAILLNVTEDHLDRYCSLRDYAAAKFRIFREQSRRDLLIYKEDDPIVKKGVRRGRARKFGFSLAGHLREGAIDLEVERYPLGGVRLVGSHNIENMIASIAAVREAGVAPATVQKVLEKFEGLPHRMEFIRERRGVRYYDDSKGTNVDAVVKSLAGFPNGRVILIAGGRDKGGRYTPLRRIAAEKVKLLVLIGEAARKIEREMKGVVEAIVAGEMERAVALAAERAREGDVVLLSPACSSFDQFKDYKERGEVFRKHVNGL